MGRQHPVRNSRWGKVGIAADIADSAAHGVGSTGQILAHIPDIELHSRMEDSSRGYNPEPVPPGSLGQLSRLAELPRTPFSSNCPPLLLFKMYYS
jgi:hypothetical protein